MQAFTGPKGIVAAFGAPVALPVSSYEPGVEMTAAGSVQSTIGIANENEHKTNIDNRIMIFLM